MQDFVHLHVHSQYSILDGQASIPRLVDKAIADGMRGIAITDHGNMFAIKEFWNYVKKKNGARRDKVKQTSAAIADLQVKVDAGEANDEQQTELAKLKAEFDALPKEDFKAIIGCEVWPRMKRVITTSLRLSRRRGPKDSICVPVLTELRLRNITRA